MTINLSSGLVGLSLLSGSNSLSDYATAASAIETRAVRLAKAQFTTPVTTPPWKLATAKASESTQISSIKAMKTIIDAAATGTGALPEDVQTAFTTYKALDRLRVLAESASKTTTSSAARTALEKTFAQGISDLQKYLGTAPTDALKLSFAQPKARAQSVGMDAPADLYTTDIDGQGVVSSREAALPGVTGTEQFEIKLGKTGTSDTVTVDLSGTPQPPTLDSVAAAINTAIAAIPLRDANGAVVLDDKGNPTPKWGVSFRAEKQGTKWGLSFKRQGTETVSIDQVDAGDALMVAAGVSGSVTAISTRIMRFNDPTGAMQRQTLGTLTALDSDATERAELLAAAAKAAKTITTTTSTSTAVAASTDVLADTSAAGIATDAHGFSYVVGTTNGDTAANLSDGSNDLLLTKLDSEGKVMWQRSLGATGSAQGAAVTVAPDGSIVVAGTVSGSFDSVTADGDMLVARYDANGDEKFTTVVRSAGADSASAVAVGADGTIFVGGKSSSGGGDAFLARIDATGRLQERRTIDSGGSDAVTALAIDGSGKLLALTREGTSAKLHRIDSAQLSTDLGTLSLGTADARALAVDSDGSIAVGGATTAALFGAQIGAPAGGRDGFVARIDSALSGASVTYIATAADDQVDSVAFLDGVLYAGGRTTGALDGDRTGRIDGFISRIDASSGALQDSSQFGQVSLTTQPVRISAVAGGDSAVGALGLHRGALTPDDSAKLVAQTSLRPGDGFLIRVNDGSTRKITITADDTLTTLADRIRLITGSKATVSTSASGDDTVLRIDAKAGNAIELISGADGMDALAKLGIPAARISSAAAVAAKAPTVRPGGSYGLELTQALNVGTAKDAAIALAKITSAISVTQTGYRSLYWDDTKASIVNGSASSSSTGASTYTARTAQYQAALDRLTSTTTTTSTTLTASLLGY